MTEQPNNLILVYLRRLDEKTDRILEEVQDLKHRVTSLEMKISSLHGDLAGLHSDFAGQSARMDRIDMRLDKIEKRPGLSGGVGRGGTGVGWEQRQRILPCNPLERWWDTLHFSHSTSGNFGQTSSRIGI